MRDLHEPLTAVKNFYILYQNFTKLTGWVQQVQHYYYKGLLRNMSEVDVLKNLYANELIVKTEIYYLSCLNRLAECMTLQFSYEATETLGQKYRIFYLVPRLDFGEERGGAHVPWDDFCTSPEIFSTFPKNFVLERVCVKTRLV